MAPWLIGVSTLIYLGTAVAFAWEGRWAWALVYAGYSLANVGLIVASAP